MESTGLRVSLRKLSRSALLFMLLLPAIGCGSYGNGGGGGGTSPYIASLNPASGPVGTSVTITGNYFGATQGSSTVKFNGTTATPTSWSASSIVVPVPAGATTGSVVVNVGGVASNGVTFTVSSASGPNISSLNPASGSVGTSVTITGTNFGSSQGASSVSFNGTAAMPTSWSAASIVTPVPVGAVTGYVVVTVNGVSSNAVNFTVTSSSSSAGWTWVQDSPLVFCSTVTGSSCTITAGNLTPTVAGSVWILSVQTQNNVTITNVSGGGGSWVHCPNCHATNHYNIDAWYNLSGNAGTSTGISITLSGNSGFFSGQFIEILPPPGSTASFDTSGIATPSNCSGTSPTPCTAVSLSGISATDVIIQNDGGAAEAAWNSWSAPYIEDANGYGICLNCTSGAAPTVTYFPCGTQTAQTTCNPEYFAIAFKSTAGTFMPPTPQFTLVNYTAPNTAQRFQAPPNGPFIACSAGTPCSLPIPATSGSGHLLFLAAGNESGSFISSVSCSPVACPSGWTIPSGASTCQQTMTIQSAGYAMSCAYNTSIPSGVTSLNITMSRNGNETFAALEASSTTGTIVFDAQNNFTGANQQEFITSPVLGATGSNDFVIQLFANAGGSLGSEFYAQPYNIASFNYFFGANESIAILPNSGSPVPQITWINCCWTVSNPPSVTFGSGIAFRAQ